MAASNKAVKVTALNALRQNWLKAIAVSCVLIFAYFISALSASLIYEMAGNAAAGLISLLLEAFILAPLLLGAIKYFWRIILGVCDNPVSVFYYYSQKPLYLKAIKLVFLIVLKLLGIALVLYIPAMLLWLVSQSYLYDLFNISIPVWVANLEDIRLLATSMASVVLMFISVKYYMAAVLIAADENMDCDEAINMSTVISKKTALDFIFLAFSFAGWIVLSVFVMPLIFTLPYIITAYAVHVRFSVAEYNLHIEALKENEFEGYSVG